MSFSLILFIIIHVVAVVFFLEALRRIRQRAHEYPITDSSATLPFGLIRLRHMVVLYIIGYLAWFIFSFWLYFGWLAQTSGEKTLPKEEVILNL